ncbi:MAG: Rrf2 family transcriptional regulator [Clostridiales bacterium]|nr:Rrf2 family transcriptional regulator [Candidatus Blautia equi]
MISTKGRYALRVMLDLAEQNTDQYVPLKEIAERQDISEKYLEIILKTLVKEKLLKGLRGKGGGYRLTRSPKDYSVGEILELSEGTLSSVACLAPDAEECPRCGQCNTLPMWKKFDAMVHDYFYNISLEDIIKEDLEAKQTGIEYFI